MVAKRNEILVEIERSYYLMRAFNAINNDENSPVKYIYHDVKFWREDYEFVMEYNGRLNRVGEIYDFDEFENTILNQKK